MKEIAKLNTRERAFVFRQVAAEMGIIEAIVEKDFWVCWTLFYLFEMSKWKRALAFKGGTSLSKGFKLIERFSEDVDIILDWRLFGCDDKIAWSDRSGSKEDKFVKDLNISASEFLKTTFLDSLNDDFSVMLNEDFSLFIDESDPQTVCFRYPQVFEDIYIQKIIRIEAGAIAAWTPATQVNIEPFISEKFRNRMQNPSTNVLTVAPERTFWEKATILHKEAYRQSGFIPERYSRHYYDLYKMYNSPVKDLAYNNLDLLTRVVNFKNKFYRSASARYDLAIPATLKLVPKDNHLNSVKDDYKAMAGMIYGTIPDFKKIIECLSIMEREINELGQAKLVSLSQKE
ncbi:nucleotidyl transferase AbiEii/AbiGii toxin family protein [Acidaminobacter sp.]|uniref:nucleotidyl transferase AbiEii/AbiGii toxin family protein n=1 Tax=Acidaminobacter sp. TaxID=1872102 RepID=UPI00255EBA20|nr:nucleotidyl transferase AbiEii/AbiGii toxin family protein [Acidaminobacter sp.]MDK9711151.1 nucleotidyl transferase AbiEii/AbiGii toxin family protein [Acidaminobacter sp.]